MSSFCKNGLSTKRVTRQFYRSNADLNDTNTSLSKLLNRNMDNSRSDMTVGKGSPVKINESKKQSNVKFLDQTNSDEEDLDEEEEGHQAN